MEKATQIMKNEINDTEFVSPKNTIISNVTGEAVNEVEKN